MTTKTKIFSNQCGDWKIETTLHPNGWRATITLQNYPDIYIVTLFDDEEDAVNAAKTECNEFV